MPPITVLIADRNKSTRTICSRLLQDEKGIQLVGEARNGLELISAFTRLKPRILLLNVNLLNKKRGSLFRTLRSKSRRTKVVLLTRRVSESALLEAFSYGVQGYLRENLITTFLPKTVRAIHEGEAWVPRKMVSKIIDYLANLTTPEECSSDTC